MSRMRLNHLVMEGILPFNFGMFYQDWKELYKNSDFRELITTDPSTWNQETIDRVNQTAQKQLDLYNYLMSLEEKQFYKEVEKLKEDIE